MRSRSKDVSCSDGACIAGVLLQSRNGVHKGIVGCRGTVGWVNTTRLIQPSGYWVSYHCADGVGCFSQSGAVYHEALSGIIPAVCPSQCDCSRFSLYNDQVTWSTWDTCESMLTTITLRSAIIIVLERDDYVIVRW